MIQRSSTQREPSEAEVREEPLDRLSAAWLRIIEEAEAQATRNEKTSPESDTSR